jgi:hypothetical protein
MKTFVKQLLAAGVAISMVGCTTVQSLTVDPSHLSSALKRGDQVQIVTSRGEQLQFKIDTVDANGLQGGGQHVAYNDIQSISRKQVDVGRTALVVLGVVAAGAVAASAGGGGGGGGNGY